VGTFWGFLELRDAGEANPGMKISGTGSIGTFF